MKEKKKTDKRQQEKKKNRSMRENSKNKELEKKITPGEKINGRRRKSC